MPAQFSKFVIVIHKRAKSEQNKIFEIFWKNIDNPGFFTHPVCNLFITFL